MMLEALLDPDGFNTEELECVFLEALYCSLGATLLDSGRIKFDEYIKKLSNMTVVQDAAMLAGTGEIPGEIKYIGGKITRHNDKTFFKKL